MKTLDARLRPPFFAMPRLPLVLAGATAAVALVVAGLGLWLNAWALPDTSASAQPVPVYDATGAMLAALGPASSEGLAAPAATRLVPVYDATGAMLTAVSPAAAAGRPAPAYDASSVQMTVIAPWVPPYRPLPVYDAAGAMWQAVPSLQP
jgi:hypothetical protein